MYGIEAGNLAKTEGISLMWLGFRLQKRRLMGR